MCQRLNTGESNNFYFGVFICIGPLRPVSTELVCPRPSLLTGVVSQSQPSVGREVPNSSTGIL